jgi:hypothetical protein
MVADERPTGSYTYRLPKETVLCMSIGYKIRKIHICTGINTRPFYAFRKGQEIFSSPTETVLTGYGTLPDSCSIDMGVLSLSSEAIKEGF